MFSVIIPGRPCLTDIVAVDRQPSGQPTKFAFTFPLTPSFTDVVVFFLPGTVLPQDTAVAVYIQFPEANPDPNGPAFRFIGALANEKPSAVFKVRPGESTAEPQRSEAQEEDEMLDEGTSNTTGGASAGGMVTLGDFDRARADRCAAVSCVGSGEAYDELVNGVGAADA